MSRAWVVNLDAEYELELGAPYAPPKRFLRAMTRAVELFATQLPEGDLVLELTRETGAVRGLDGACFCPTPSALARLERAGARPPASPHVDVLRAVNERGFGHTLGHLEGTRRCEGEDDALAALSRPGRWLAKRGLGFAGRGQRRIDAPPTDADRGWVRASLRRGALYVERRVEIALEVAIHGLVHPDGSHRLGLPTVQRVEHGAWRGSWRATPGELEPSEEDALHWAGDRVARALVAAGYFGPFGVDAFRYREGREQRFHGLSEVNARYTMAWSTGMGVPP